MGTDEGLSRTDHGSSAADAGAEASAPDRIRSTEPDIAEPGRKRPPGGHKRRRRRRPPRAKLLSQPQQETGPDVAVPAAEALREPAIEQKSPRQRTYAALDLGTNNCRLLVAVPRDRGFHVVDSFSRIVRLGEGIGHTGRLSEPAMDRAIAALKICAGKLARREVTAARLIATEACRFAENGEAFVERVRVETGLSLEIVTRETEARLAAAGCASLIDPQALGAILFDIGGGSSELVWLDLSRVRGAARRRVSQTIRSWQSLPVGVVNLSERHGGHHVDAEIFEAMVSEVAELLDAFPQVESLDRAVAGGGMHMIGTSGTVTTLAGVHLGLPRYDRRQVDGLWMTDEEIGAMIATLRDADYEARVANPCIGQDRADLVLAGCAILEAIRRRWHCARMRVADRGLREGILVELMAADGVWRRRRRRRRQSARSSGDNG